jgi:chemotaxis methyl-accepting protein methylase
MGKIPRFEMTAGRFPENAGEGSLSGTAVENAREARFRHIVFRTPGRAARPPVDHAPLPPDPSLPTAPAAGTTQRRLSREDAGFIGWLFERAGVDVEAYRGETLSRRLPACLRTLRARSVAQARQRVEQQPGLTSTAMSAMLIGVSEFFRDAAVFDSLARQVVPALPRRAGHPRIWSIGCSDGQELYSVAMLLAEQGMLGGATLLGTDCRPAAVALARDGRYHPDAVRGRVPTTLARRYFVDDHDTGTCRIREELRAATQWRSGDATRLVEPGAWDLILCRNMSMYLRSEQARRLREVCERALRVGGFLVMGKAERPYGSTRLAPLSPCVYRKD